MKINLKNAISLILLLIISISILLPCRTNATYKNKMSSLITNQDSTWNDSSETSGKVRKVMNSAIAIIRIVGMCIAVTMLLVIAIKYMSAAPGEKADIKKASIGYVVGALVLFGAVGILGIISKFSVNIG